MRRWRPIILPILHVSRGRRSPRTLRHSRADRRRGDGQVYRARDPRLGRDVALKVLPSAFSANPERLHRFEQEARAAVALNHPNILAVFDLGQHEGAPFIVSELLEGDTLRDRLRTGVLPARKAIEYAIQIAHGLAAAHEKGIVHRDLKPGRRTCCRIVRACIERILGRLNGERRT